MSEILYELKRTVAPAEEPITPAQARNFLKLPDNVTTDDSLIEDILIPHARDYVERYTKRALISQTWDLIADCPYSPVILPLGQITLVNSVKVILDDDTENTQAATLYHSSTG